MVRIADFYKLCNVTQVNHANFMVRVGLNVFIEQKRKLLEVWFYMNGPSKLHAAISSKPFWPKN